MWTCVIALYQILSIINTPNYKALYGDDPLTEWPYNEKQGSSLLPTGNGKMREIENVKFYSDFSNYSPRKVPYDNGNNNRLVTTISITSPTDIFEKDFSNLQNQMGSRNRLIGMVFYNGTPNNQQKF